MVLVLGIDPGWLGAFALIDSGNPHKILDWRDMPVVYKTVGKNSRPRLDLFGVELLIKRDFAQHGKLVMATIEDPGVRPSQTGAFAFGFGTGAIHMALHNAQIRTEIISPKVWKPALRAPKDKREAVTRASELFPEDRELFYGPRGGVIDGRAEAAMIALYGAKNLL